MQLNKFYEIKTARHNLPFYTRKEVFCCILQDYNNMNTLIFEPTPLEPFPLLDYARKDVNNVIVTTISPMSIHNRGFAHPMTTLMGTSFHYGALNTELRTRSIRTYIPLFKLYRIVGAKSLVGPAQMSRTDIPTTQYYCEHGFSITNTDLPLSDEGRTDDYRYAKMTFDWETGSADYIVEFLDPYECRAELRDFKRDMASACTQHVQQQLMMQQQAQYQRDAQQLAAAWFASQQYYDYIGYIVGPFLQEVEEVGSKAEDDEEEDGLT